MSKFIQQRYEESILELRSIPFTYTNYLDGYRGWSTSTRILLSTRHYDVLNSLHYFFMFNGYTGWEETDFREHMKKIAFEKNWRGGQSYKPFDFVHESEKSRWPSRTQYHYRHKRSYIHNPNTKKKEKREPRWSDRKKSWKKEHNQSGWKKCMKDTSNRSMRIETRKKIAIEEYDSIPNKHKKFYDYDYW